MSQYIYKAERLFPPHEHDYSVNSHLNQLGSEGWELVSVVYDNKCDLYWAFLKRQEAARAK